MDWVGIVERDGYAIIPDVIGPEEVSELVAALDAARPGRSAMDRDGRVYAMRNLLGEIPETRRLAGSEALIRLARPILGSGARVVRGLLFDKTADANWLVPWHQDLTIAVKSRTDAPGYGPWTIKAGVPHVRPPIAVLEKMLTVRLHLDDSGEANGPLRVLPGSHARGRLDAGATRAWLDRVPAIPCIVPRGGAVVMRPLILHASSPAETPGHRRVIHLEYAADPLPGGVEWFEG